jgi:curved DNA-binding protein CbpA
MITINSKTLEKVVLELVESTDLRRLSKEFLKDRVFFYSVLKDISRGKDSPNYRVIRKIAKKKKIKEDFIVDQARSIISYLAPEEPREDYYRVLNVSPSATPEEIRRSWLILVKEYHPDKMGAYGLDITKKLNEAYEVLGNPQRRAEYDAKRIPEYPVVVRDFGVGKGVSLFASVAILFVVAVLVYMWRLSPSHVQAKREVAVKEEAKEPVLALKTPSPPEPKEVKVSRREETYTVKETPKQKEPLKPKEGKKEAVGEEKTISEPEEKERVVARIIEEEKKQVETSGSENVRVFPALRVERKEEVKPATEENKKEEFVTKEAVAGGKRSYTVKQGDSLWLIARRFNVSVDDIVRANGLKDLRLDVGDVLTIPEESKEKEVALEAKREEKRTEEKKPERKEVSLLDRKTREAKAREIGEAKRKQPAFSEGKREGDSTSPVAKASFLPDTSSIYSFFSEYVSAYKSRDFKRFIELFTPDARENGVSLRERASSYRKNFSSLEIVSYDIDIKRVNLSGETASVSGDFAVTFRKANESRLRHSSGTIDWVLLWHKTGWRVKEISYSVRDVR